MKNYSNKIVLVFILVFSLNSLAQCPTVVPSEIDNCSLSAGSVELGASGSSGIFSWYDAITAGNFLASGNTFNTPHITSTTSYYVSAAKENIGLDFDGLNDRINLGNPAKLQITGDMTIEMWVKPDNFSSRKNLYAKAYGGEGTITQEMSGTLSYYYGINGGNGGPYQGFSTNVSLIQNEWSHIAIVRDLASMQLYWYINGVLVNQVAANYAAAVSGGNNAFIGDGYVNNYDGQIDEFRIWNTSRSQSEINSSKNICLNGNEAGLVSYYQFEDNTGIQLTDLTTPVNHGMLINMGVSPWVVVSRDYSCVACESGRVEVVATINGGVPLELGVSSFVECGTPSVLDAGSGYSNYLWNTGETTQTIETSLSGPHWVTVDDGAGCSDGDTIKVELSSGAGHVLDFNGTNQYVYVGNKDNLNIVGDLTIEMWLKPDNFSSRKNPFAKAYGGEGTITQEISGFLTFYYGSSGGNANPYQGFSTSTSLTLNEWNHVAIVRNLGTMELSWYINGILVNRANALYVPAVSALPVLVSNGYTNEYDGQIEELRVWSSARSEAQIKAKMCSKILTDEPSLELYYRFDNSSGNNVTDLSGNTNDGLLVNSPNWTVSSASVGDKSSYLYTNSWTGQTVTHSVCGGENLTVKNMTGTPDGVHIYSVGSVPNNVSGISGLGDNNRYFGVHKVNDNTATYDALYSYAGNPFVDLNNDVDLLLFKRSNNADSPWVNTGAVPLIVANTIMATASSTEFILGSSISPLPVELTSFNVIENNGNAEINWTTQTELNNDYFSIEKSLDGLNWRELTQVTGAGNSSSTIDYFEVDQNPYPGVSYYRLVQVDFDGVMTYGPKAALNIETKGIIVFPNPFKNEINITNLSEHNRLQVYAMDGKLMFEGNSSSIDTYDWVSGLYELIIFNQDNSIVDRFKIIK